MNKLYDWKEKIDKQELEDVIKTLKNDGIVVVPTETVYGISANAYSNIACKKIFESKGRAQDNPLIVHVCDKNMIYEIVKEPNKIEKDLIDAFMPGPFTLILNKKENISDVASANMSTIGIRMPSNEIIHKIIEKSGLPLAAPSANISGRPSGTCIEDIKQELGDRVDILIDGGECKIGIESTVVKVIDGIPTILRPGFITEDDIKKAVGCVRLSDKLFKKVEKNEKVESPGMKYRHYAPRTKCILVSFTNEQINKVNDLLKQNPEACVLGFKEDQSLLNISEDKFICLGSKNNLPEISRNVFTSLRKVDKINSDLAIVEGVEKKDLGLSIMNRLIRACENNEV